MTSCLREEDDVFGEAPAIRMQKTIAGYKSLLTDAPNGWIINYYPEQKYGVGGYAIYCKFSADGKVDVACEVKTNVDSYEIASSTWDIIPYQGPVLTFDTYSPVVHYFSEVSSTSDRDGRAGDYDFVVMKAVKDTFYLSGLKNENKIVMWKCPENPIEYLKQVNAFASSATRYKTFNIVQNGDSIGTIKMSGTITNNLLNRVFTAEYSDTTITVPFYYTSNELRLQKPLEIKGTSIEGFTWDKTNSRYIVANTNIVLQYVGTKIYLYEEFLGKYKLYYSSSNATPPNRNRSLEVSLIQETEGVNYRLEGLLADNSPGKIIVSYVDGQIEVLGQIMYTYPDTKYDFWLLPYSYNIDGNYVSTSTTYGLISDKIEDVGGKLQFNLVDNKRWTSHGGTAGFLLRNYNGSTNAGNVNGKDGQAYYYFWRFEKQ
jgi:hypothetical protein